MKSQLLISSVDKEFSRFGAHAISTRDDISELVFFCDKFQSKIIWWRLSLSQTWCRYVTGNVRQHALTSIIERSYWEIHSSHIRLFTRKFTTALTCRTLPSLINSSDQQCVPILFAKYILLPSGHELSIFLNEKNTHVGSSMRRGNKIMNFDVNAWVTSVLIDDSNRRFAWKVRYN